MKRACFTFGALFIVLGIVLSSVGLRMGGDTSASVHLFGRTWTVNAPFSGGGHHVFDRASTPIQVESADYLMPGGSAATYLESQEAFNSIYLDVDLGDVTIAAGDSYGVSIDYWGSGYKVDSWNNDGQLTIESDGGSGHIVGNSVCGSTIVIYVPSDTELDSISVDLDLGSLTLAGVTVHDVTADLDLGKFIGDSLTVLGSLDVDADLGDVTVYGRLGEYTSIDADLGRVELGLSNPVSDYAWSLTAGLGSVSVDGRTRGTNTTVTGGQGDNWIEVDADLGSITVDFDESNPTPNPPQEPQAVAGTQAIDSVTFYNEAETAVTEQSAS